MRNVEMDEKCSLWNRIPGLLERPGPAPKRDGLCQSYKSSTADSFRIHRQVDNSKSCRYGKEQKIGELRIRTSPGRLGRVEPRVKRHSRKETSGTAGRGREVSTRRGAYGGGSCVDT